MPEDEVDDQAHGQHPTGHDAEPLCHTAATKLREVLYCKFLRGFHDLCILYSLNLSAFFPF